MADSRKKRGKADRARISATQSAEVNYVARKYRRSAAAVRAAIKKVGNSRDKVYAELGIKLKKRRKKRKAKKGAAKRGKTKKRKAKRRKR